MSTSVVSKIPLDDCDNGTIIGGLESPEQAINDVLAKYTTTRVVNHLALALTIQIEIINIPPTNDLTPFNKPVTQEPPLREFNVALTQSGVKQKKEKKHRTIEYASR